MTDTETEAPRASDHFHFKPKTDITAYELALIFEKLDVQATFETLGRFPAEVRRHFVGRPRSAPVNQRRRPG